MGTTQREAQGGLKLVRGNEHPNQNSAKGVIATVYILEGTGELGVKTLSVECNVWDGWKDGWMDGWMEGWMDVGWMVRWMDGWMDGWIIGK